MKRIVIALAALSFATPAKALTLAEFWEPFTSEHYHYDRGPRHYNEDRCRKVHYDYYYYVPGYYDGRRYVKGRYEIQERTKYIDCYRRPHHHHH